jgi:predicted Zn-ribbon and HTH transcriptional regulator
MDISRWANTQIRREVACPKCMAEPMAPCRTPNGRITLEPHGVRSIAYIEKIGRTEWDRRHSVRLVTYACSCTLCGWQGRRTEDTLNQIVVCPKCHKPNVFPNNQLVTKTTGE